MPRRYENRIEYLRQYKFAIAFENSATPGYSRGTERGTMNGYSHGTLMGTCTVLARNPLT